MQKVLNVLKVPFAWAEKHKKIFDAICAVLLAYIPIFQHYHAPIESVSSWVLAAMVPYLMLRVLPKLPQLRGEQLSLIFVLLLFFLYKLINHGTRFFEIMQVGLFAGFLVAAALYCIDTEMLTKFATCVACAASICIIIQYVCYYLLGFHLQMVPLSMLSPNTSQWFSAVKTGVVGITGSIGSLYRPSAFFLEPSHLFLYSFPLLFINLFDTKNGIAAKIAAVMISVALILCTSGMGIAVCAGAWVAFLALYDEKSNSFAISNLFRKRNLVVFCGLLIVFAAAIIFVPFIRASVLRIFVKNAAGSTAISGRTSVALRIISRMKPYQWVIGVSDTTAGLGTNMPGFMATLYKYGAVGVVLSYEYYVKGLFKLDVGYFWFAAVLLVVSFFSTHTHGGFFMLYYILLLMHGYKTSTGEWISQLKTFAADIFKWIKTLFYRTTEKQTDQGDQNV